jgi:Flp pilus assembly protein TadG
MKRKRLYVRKDRRGVIAVLSAILLVLMLSMVAFAVDLGYIGMSKTQLQVAADASALAAAGVINQGETEMVTSAKTIAEANRVAGRNIQLNTSDVQTGNWDATARTFTPSSSSINSVKVTVRTAANSGGSTPLFFARIFGKTSIDQSASAVATVNPRDIAFVVDLSRSMNFDTNPSQTATEGLLQNIYADFGFETYPGASQYVGQPLGIADNSNWATNLTKNGGPLRDSTKVAARYLVTNNDSNDVKTWKAYAWVMEVQLPSASLMPNVIPVPNAGVSANYNYWKAYIDQYRSSLGYLSYVTLMMDSARDYTVGGSYTPLSLKSNLCECPRKEWTVNGETFRFPPREMPTHAARRALIAALQAIRDRNASVSDVDHKDWVSIITYDSESTEALKWSLANKDNYAGAMQICKDLQACGGTGTEGGLDLAYNHLQYGTPCGNKFLGRKNANKIVVLLTDGQPNQRRSFVTSSLVNSYIGNNPCVWTNPNTGAQVNNWITSGTYATDMNAALMRANIMRGEHWNVHAAGIGLGCDYNFMDCMARQGMTADTNGQSPRGSEDPSVYEAKLRKIFQDIVTNPKLRLVQ